MSECGFAGVTGADAMPAKKTSRGKDALRPSNIAWAAFPTATTRTLLNCDRSMDSAPQRSSDPSCSKFRCMVSEMSIAAKVSWKIRRASCFKSAMEDYQLTRFSKLRDSKYLLGAFHRKNLVRLLPRCTPFSCVSQATRRPGVALVLHSAGLARDE